MAYFLVSGGATVRTWIFRSQILFFAGERDHVHQEAPTGAYRWDHVTAQLPVGMEWSGPSPREETVDITHLVDVNRGLATEPSAESPTEKEEK